MHSFIGDYPCKVDAKGRLVMPAFLRRVLGAGGEVRFVIKKNIYASCLDLVTTQEWDKQLEVLRSKVNIYNREHSLLLREFFRGTAEVVMDASGRILLPKRLLEQVKIKKEVIVAGQGTKMEIWDHESYQQESLGDEKFMRMANEILGEVRDEE